MSLRNNEKSIQLSAVVHHEKTEPNPPLFHRAILEAANSFGDEIALTDTDTGTSQTFGRLHQKAIQLAAMLHLQFGIGTGDLILCILPNCLAYPMILLAGPICGAPIAGAPPDSSIEELALFIAKTGCRAIFASGTNGHLEWIAGKAAEMGIPLFLVDKYKSAVENTAFGIGIDLGQLMDGMRMDEPQQLEAFMAMAPDNGLSLDATFMAPLSSGASGVPKVVLQTHRNFYAATEILKKSIFDELTTRGGGRRSTIAAQPFYHASGLWILCYCLLTGHRSLIMTKFNPATYLGLVQEHKIDTLSLGPWLISLLLKQNLAKFNLSSVRTIISGGSSDATNAVQNAQFLGHFPVVTNFLIGYGMTEIVLISHMTPLDIGNDDQRRLHSVGKLLPGFEYKLVDCQTGEDLAQIKPNPFNANYQNDGRPPHGELWLRSDCVMAGYLNESDGLNQRTIDQEGWFHTGDVLWKDDDDFFFYLDRLSNMIRVNGDVEVWPAELESVLLMHPKVLECSVIGVDVQNANGNVGEVPRAFVVLKIEVEKGIMPPKVEKHYFDHIEEKIRQFANAHLSHHQRLPEGGVILVESLPKTPFGKVAKQKVRQMAKEMDQMKEKARKAEDDVVIEEASRNVIEVALEDAFRRVHLTAIEITTKVRWKNGEGTAGEAADKATGSTNSKTTEHRIVKAAEKQMIMVGRKEEDQAKDDEVDKKEKEKNDVDENDAGKDEEDKDKADEADRQNDADTDEADLNKPEIEAEVNLAKKTKEDNFKKLNTKESEDEAGAAEESGRKTVIKLKDGMKMEGKEVTTNEEAKDKVEIRRKAASIAGPFEGIKSHWETGTEKGEGKCCEGGGEDDDETVGLLEEDEQEDADVEEDDNTDTVL